jgi:hypothetical protein
MDAKTAKGNKMSDYQEILDVVQEAQSKSKFRLADVIKGVGYPEDIVDVYLDAESAYELTKVSDRLDEAVTVEEISALEERADELSEKIKKSKLSFYMRGIDQKQVEAIEEQAKIANPENWGEEYICALVASNVYKVVDADGEEDNSVFTSADAAEWRGSLPAESWATISSTMQKLTLASGYFKGLTDAGFLQKS